MITAHLPAGYCLARLGAPKLRYAVPVALIASILPDLDLFWFYFVDNRSFHHHEYWVHTPAFWAAVWLVTLPIAVWTRCIALHTVFFSALLLHMVLDTLVGGIPWLQPFDDRLFRLFEVQPTENHWLVTFLTHWSMLAELAIWALAAWLLHRQRANAT